MIAVDASALIAILYGEADGEALFDRLTREDAACITGPTLLETRMVDHGRSKTTPGAELDRLLKAGNISCVDFTSKHAHLAHVAFLTYGKGSGHRAQLNFGDCMAYALAKALDAPLLFKGNDFSLTDIRSAL